MTLERARKDLSLFVKLDVHLDESFKSVPLLSRTLGTLEAKVGHDIRSARRLVAIQHTEETKDVPSWKSGWHKPMALKNAQPWNMQQPGSSTSWPHIMQCRSLDTTVGKS